MYNQRDFCDYLIEISSRDGQDANTVFLKACCWRAIHATGDSDEVIGLRVAIQRAFNNRR